jgi:S-adenosylmethionine synthetase
MGMQKDYFFTSESVSEGHPDKVADYISDSILDAFLTQEPEARVAVETLVTTNLVVLAGEVRASFTPDYEKIVRTALKDIGYTLSDFDADTVEIINRIHTQSSEIAQGVDEGEGKEEGAGDQGLMFGYATKETKHLMPAPIHYSQKIMEELAKLRKAGETRLRPDAKCQLTVEYRDDQPVRVDTVVVSHQHTEELDQTGVSEIAMKVVKDVLPSGWIDGETKIHVNPTGSFIHGGPGADTGLTGRKIIVDTYGGMARHGGGAFSGKDPTKVDRSAAYVARYLAKNVVAADLADFCEIQLCYAIGVPEPLAIYLDTFGTAKVAETTIVQAIRASMKLTPRGIREHLGLNKPIYAKTAAYGHFGREAEGEFFPWEKTDLAETLKKHVTDAIKLVS